MFPDYYKVQVGTIYLGYILHLYNMYLQYIKQYDENKVVLYVECKTWKSCLTAVSTLLHQFTR